MRILFIGDIVGKSGRAVVSSFLPVLKEKYSPDLVIANAENSAHGKGITYRVYRSIIESGVEYMTMGNHTFSKAEIYDYLTEMNRMVVPYNHSKRIGGNYYLVFEKNGLKICLMNILGNALIGESNLPYSEAMDIVLNETQGKNIDLYICDFHAEATAEKRIFAEYYKDKVKVIVGTHTHVQTADEKILDGCAFISDIGMCGAYSSVIGRDIDESVRSAIRKEKTSYTVAEGPAEFNAVIIDIDETVKKAVSIERIQIRPDSE